MTPPLPVAAARSVLSSTLRRARAASPRALRLASGATVLPLAIARAVIRSPELIRNHPASAEVRSLLRAGFAVESITVGRRGAPTVVELVRGDDHRTVRNPDPAFAIFTRTVLVGGPARLMRSR
ncbi:MAG: hypothetical protein ACOYXM_04610 [Actinomycetota bacterium]